MSDSSSRFSVVCDWSAGAREALAAAAGEGDLPSAIMLASMVALTWSHPAAQLVRSMHYDRLAAGESSAELRSAMLVLQCTLTGGDAPCFCGTHPGGWN